MNGYTFADSALAIGGLGLFLLGIRMASDGLKGLAAGRVKIVLSILTGRRTLAAGAGAAITFLLQSSTASTVMLVGLANVGLLNLQQAAGVAVGNCLGSTLIVQLIAFDVSAYALLGVAAGLLVKALSRHRVGRSGSDVLIGFGLLFYGIPLIRAGLEPIGHYPWLNQLLGRLGSEPGLFVLAAGAAAVFTVATQSSAATVAVAFGLARGGIISLPGALAFIYGAHAATVVTPMIAAAGGDRRGGRVVLLDLIFRLGGILIFAPFSMYIVQLAESIAGPGADPARAVAWQHTIFNAAVVLLGLPLLGLMIGAVNRLLPIRAGIPAGVVKYIDPKSADPLPIALEKARKEIHRLGMAVTAGLARAMRAVEDDDLDTLQAVKLEDDLTDLAYEATTAYLTQLPGGDDVPELAADRTRLLFALKEIEFAGDIVSKDIVQLGRKKESLGKEFSIEGERLLQDYQRHIGEHFRQANELILEPDATAAQEILDREASLAAERRSIHRRHLEQLGRNVLEAQATSSVYTDLLAALEMVARCSGEIAETVLGAVAGGRSRSRSETNGSEDA